MTEYSSRRERREAEAALDGRSNSVTQVADSSAQIADSADPVAPRQIEAAPHIEMAALEAGREQNFLAIEPAAEIHQRALTGQAESALKPALSRRELRMLEREEQPETAPSIEGLAAKNSLPAVMDTPLPAQLEPLQTDEHEFDLPIPEFTGQNLLFEPSTQSIVLDVVPEAVSLPLDSTGEIISTGGMSILSDAADSASTGALDGAQLDQTALEDAMTGAISIVAPVSALDVIRDRESVAVVPGATLRRGWWHPWAIAAGALLMTIIAIFATLVIINAIGG